MADRDFTELLARFLDGMGRLQASTADRRSALAHFEQALSEIIEDVAHAAVARKAAADAAEEASRRAAVSEAAAKASRAETVDADLLDELADLITERLHEHGSAHDLFLHYDVTHSGRLGPEEFRRAVADLGIRLTVPEVRALLQRFDTDGSGNFDYAEWVRVYTENPGMHSSYDTSYGRATVGRSAVSGDEVYDIHESEEQKAQALVGLVRSKLQRQFGTATHAFLALNGGDHSSSSLSARELSDGLAKHGLRVTSKQVRQIIAPFAESRPGHLSVKEFMLFFQGRLPRKPKAVARAPAPGADAAAGGGATSADGFALFRYAHEHTVGDASAAGSGRAEAVVPPPAPAPAYDHGRAPLPTPVTGSAEGFSRSSGVGVRARDSAEAADLDRVRRAVNDALYESEHGVRGTFKRMITKKGAGVSPEEFKRGMHRIGLNLTSDQVNALFAEHDLDHSGRMSYAQFVKMLNATI